MVLFLGRGGEKGENITKNLVKPIKFDFKNSLSNGAKGVLDMSPAKNQDFSQFFMSWPSSRFLKNVRDLLDLEKGTNKH